MSSSRLVAASLTLFVACSSQREWVAEFKPPTAKGPEATKAPFLKAHLRDGAVFVFDRWKMDTERRVLGGHGLGYDAARVRTHDGPIELSWDTVVLVETNRPTEVDKGSFIVLGVMTGITFTVTALCIASPKSCFGSCPTFFTADGRLVAEGFSASIARSLEATDLDALPAVETQGGPFTLRMTNEALETHYVDSVRLLSLPRPPGGGVAREDGVYWGLGAPTGPLACQTNDGHDCRAPLAALDESEYKSDADAQDLATRESLELVFPAQAGEAGLLVTARNSLLNTYVFYQMLAFMGTRAGEWMTRLETSGPLGPLAARGIGQRLGDVEVEVLGADGQWRRAGAFAEVGPIARETQLVRLPGPRPAGDVRVRLTMARGNWRLDRVALVAVGAPLEPRPVPLARVERSGARQPEALSRLQPGDDRLVVWPGEAYTLHFDLPPGEQQLFLESRGFYTEWMRESWLAEEDEPRLRRLLADPAGALRELAPGYKTIEADMDRIFWSSRWSDPR